MKKLLFSLFIFFQCINTFYSQNISVDLKHGDLQEENGSYIMESNILDSDDGFIYIFKYSMNAMGKRFTRLEKYDQNLKLIKTLNFSKSEYDNLKLLPSYTIYYNNKIYLFSTSMNKKMKSVLLYAQTIDKESLELNNDTKKIIDIDYTVSHREFAKYGLFKYQISKNKSKLLISYSPTIPLPYLEGKVLINGEIGTQYDFTFVFNKDLSLIKNHNIERIYSKKNILDHEPSFNIDNEGNIYHLIEKEGQLIMQCHKTNTNELSEYNFDQTTYYNSKIELDENNNIILYSLNKEGIYFLVLNSKTNDIIKKHTLMFNQLGRDIKEFFELKNIFSKKEGGFIFLLEFQLTSLGDIKNPNSPSGTPHGQVSTNYYKDVLAISINNAGEILWNTNIAKKQVIYGRHFEGSFISGLINDNIYLIFNDNNENIPYNENQKLETFQNNGKSIVTIVKIDKNGNQKRDIIYNVEKEGKAFHPIYSKQINNYEFILNSFTLQSKVTIK